MASGITCENYKESNIWLTVRELRPTFGPGDNWKDYCMSIFNETFARDPVEFPCLSTCGFCKGRYIETPTYGKICLK